MSKPVLFSSIRPLERSENIHAILKAYPGPKEYFPAYDRNYRFEVQSGKYDLLVTDDFPAFTPGKCIMIWHGIQGGKYIGLDQPGTPYYRPEMAQNMTYIISGSLYMRDIWSRCTGVPFENILPLGMPRTDAYIGKRKGDGHTILSGKRSYLYVPTFRDKNETPLPDIDWDYIDSTLDDDELFVVKSHPWYAYYSKDPVDVQNRKHIIRVSAEEPSARYLYDCDVVITDYSSIMFDAYLLDKPVVLFEKNPGYVQSRGMYLQYPEQYSSRYATTEQSLIHFARNAYTLGETEINCRRTVAEYCDGHACERLCKLIEELR